MKSKYCSESVAAEYAWVFLEFENIVTFLSDNTPQKTLLLTLFWKKNLLQAWATQEQHKILNKIILS